MPSLLESTDAAVRRFICESTVDGSALVNWIDRAASGIGGGALSETPAGRFGLGAGQALRGLVCPAPTTGQGASGGPAVTYPPAGFEPGQCELVPYLFEWRYRQTNGQLTTQTLDSLFGPIGQIIRRELPNNRVEHVVPCRGVFGLGTEPPGFEFSLLNEPLPGSTEAEILSLTRRDGGVDDCGAPLGQDPPTGTDSIDYDDPDGNPVTDAPIVFAPSFPIILPTGALIIPITVDVGGLTFVANFNIGDLSITFDFAGGQPGSEVCCPPTEIPDIDDNPPESPPPPDSPLRYWGVLVRAVIGPSANITTVGDAQGKETYLPDLGWCRFAIDIGGKRGWTEKVEIQTIPQLVSVPAPAVAYDFDIHERPGVTIETFPVIVQGTDT